MKHSENEFMQHELRLPELTMRGMILGAILTIIFTASNVYLGLKVGLTFSSAIPAAVISMAVLKMAKDANILENNMVQTQASAAGTLSAIIFIIPGMLMIGYWQDFEFWQTLVVSACGGCLGVLFTIPLRRAMVVHSDLAYPEGVAAAEILKVGSHDDSREQHGSGLKEILSGSAIAGVIAFLTNGLQVLGGSLSAWFHVGRGMTQLPLGYSSALVGAGYLIGITSGLAMLIGIAIAWAGFVPYFTITGALPDGMTLQKFAGTVYQQKVRLIGAGAMGVAAIWTLLCLARPVIDGVKESIAGARADSAERGLHRMDIDMTMKSVGLVFAVTVIGLLVIFYAFVSPEQIPGGQKIAFTLVGVSVAVLMGFFVAAACAYMAGLVGTSSSPISGIGILGIIVASLVMYALCSMFGIFSLPGGEKFATATAIFTTSIILAIACISNDNMQDLKTGYLVGATPWRQQVALLIGCVVGALVIAPVLNLLYEAYGFSGALPRAGMDPAQALAAPQAVLMTTIAQGIFSQKLAWEYIYIGIGVGIVLVLIDLFLRRSTKNLAMPPLAVGMGIYLPPVIQTPLVVGAILGYFVNRHLRQTKGEEAERAGLRRGTLFASGLIVGESIIGVLLAGIIVVSVSNGGGESPLAIAPEGFADTAEMLGLLVFIAVLAIFGKVVLGGKKEA
ncbi:OPT family oligopeptide transporter [uncultured Selenomonas sp.]|uniref:OPT family oligopeptide transporter n=1 Tax=uncultured Selenomonas sp. TaxID=159275 RepID=UPI0028E768EE|nr:oligopeptide transporter, OPT family [uncultured Selenomonas sp.]